ncbi:hypothetical protein [Acidovorax sp. A1169]|uniref:hypothetical protein n=1 Tax=Acidovorax sp. A1169 TaxID=3059524 RepID=UPI002737D8EB|nr:hypothetical protein [Acidovorax sp. A1169]MDP4074951.1 hypothetical protein [Acidovorax sp. A1169]
MTILAGDIKLLASRVMTDDPEGGGGPTGTAIPDGGSNGIWNDVSELDRANGDVSVRQLHLAVRTNNTDTYLGAQVIVSKPPNDANVCITLAKCAPFARRTEIANSIESYLIQSSEWSGYLLENHVAGQNSIQVFQRPGSVTPAIGRTLVLVYNEDQPTERRQYIRINRVEVQTRTFSYSVGNGYVDYTADVVVCELSDDLRFNFPGSPPDRSFVRLANRTVLRDTTVADAATYYGATTLTAVADLGAASIKVASVYTQLVPSARTETVALDLRPAAVRNMVLAETPRRVEVGAAPHTRRIKIGQENRRRAYTDLLLPLPAPGTVVISYMALGNWYTVVDDGMGAFTGPGAGQIVYTTGSLAITLQEMPDVGSSVIVQWGEKVGYMNRAGGATFRKPEFDLVLEHDEVKPGTLVVTWQSGGVTKTANDNGTGGLTGDATGQILYATGRLRIRPAAMPDPGGEFQMAFEYSETEVETFSGLNPDSSGFVNMTLAKVPTPGTMVVLWLTTRTVSATEGSNSGTNLQKEPGLAYSGGVAMPSEVVTTTANAPASVAPGSTTNVAYGWLKTQMPGGNALRSDV